MLSSVSAVTIYPDTIIFANGFTLMHKISCDYTFVDVEMNYTILDSHNITYVTNVSSNRTLVSQTKDPCVWGNYTATITADIYSPSIWNLPTVIMRFKGLSDTILYSTGDITPLLHSYTQIGINKRYTYSYDPADTIPNSELGLFDVDIYVYSENATLYYYGNRTFSSLFTVYKLDPPTNYHNRFNSTNSYVNMTWTIGNNSDRTIVLQKNSTSYSSCMTDYSCIRQNSTINYYNFTVNINDVFTITLYSYNATTGSYSSPFHASWGGLALWVYNMSRTWQQVEPFNIMIQNQEGTNTYVHNGASTPLYIDLNNISIGTNTIFKINASKYQTQTYVRDTSANHYWNYTFLLPPVTTGSGGSPNNYSYVYQITVNDQAGQPIQNALVNIKIYRNATDTYEEVYSFPTDGGGHVNPWLIPNNLYQVTLSKDGYETSINYWTPTASIFTVTYVLFFTSAQPPSYTWNEIITFNGYMVNSTAKILVNYTDSLNETIGWGLYIFRVNNDSSVTLMKTWMGTNSSFQLYDMMPSNRFDYWVVIYINHTYFGGHGDRFLLYGYHPGQPVHHASQHIITAFTVVFRYNPFGWANTIGLLFILGCFFSFGRRETYMSVFLIGALEIAFHSWLGFDMITVPAGITSANWGQWGFSIGIGILILFIGILMLVRDRGMYGGS